MPALNLECSNINGSVSLTNWFVAIGRVHLHGANIRAHLDCSGGHFVNLGGHAILANHARISNGVLLSKGFYAEGEVRLFEQLSAETWSAAAAVLLIHLAMHLMPKERKYRVTCC